MPGRFPGDIPKLVMQKWDIPTQRDLEEFLRNLFKGMANLQLSPASPSQVSATSVADAGTGPAPAMDDHTHDLDISGTPSDVGVTNSQGSGPGVATIDHTHRLNIATTKGDLIVHNGTDPIRLAVGSDGQVLSADSTETSGLNWQKWMWQDLRSPATSIRLGAGGAAPNTGALVFRNGQDDTVFVSFQMPHGFNPSTVYPHIHWYKTTSASGTVNWEMRWVIADIGGTFGDITAEPWTALSEIEADANTARLHAMKGTSIDMSSYDNSSMILIALRRQSSGGGDTYGADAHLIEVDIHVQISNFGSLTQ